MLIPVPAHLLVQQDLDGAVWAACNHLSQLGINNFFHHAGDRRVTINGRDYSVVIDMVNTGVLFISKETKCSSPKNSSKHGMPADKDMNGF